MWTLAPIILLLGVVTDLGAALWDLATQRLGGDCGGWLGQAPAPGSGEHDEIERLGI